MLKNIFSFGKYIQPAINYGLKFTKAIKTFESLMKHLQAFEEDRREIWGDSIQAPNVEQKPE